MKKATLRRMSRALLLIFLAALLLRGGNSLAAEPVPGGSCSTSNQIIITGGPETSGTSNMMICNGTAWQPLFMFLPGGNVGIGLAVPSDIARRVVERIAGSRLAPAES